MFGKTGIKPGTKVNLTLKDGSEPVKSFPTNFDRDEEDDVFVIEAPLTGAFTLKDGDFVYIDYIEGVFYCDFQGKILERFVTDDLPFFRIKRLSNISQSYRREDFRLELSLDIILEQEYLNDDNESQRLCIKGRTFDVSGSGISLYLNHPVKVGEEFEATIPFDDDDIPNNFMCEIRWARAMGENSTFDYFCGAKFLHETLPDKEKMAQYIFRRQLRRIRFR